MSNQSQTTATKANDVTITRIFDAPVQAVWKAWTDPQQFMRWWGPKDFTSPKCKMDFRVGGKYHYCMQSPEGQKFWTTGTYLEIVPKEKIVWTDSFADEKGDVVSGAFYGLGDDFPLILQVTLLFAEEQGKTRLTLIHAGMPKGEMREQTAVGWNESLDKLAVILK